jgi:hypothetical protein
MFCHTEGSFVFLPELKILNRFKMKNFLIVIGIILLGVLGFYAFQLGFILVKVFIGLLFICVFAAGVWIGRLTKKSDSDEK